MANLLFSLFTQYLIVVLMAGAFILALIGLSVVVTHLTREQVSDTTATQRREMPEKEAA